MIDHFITGANKLANVPLKNMLGLNQLKMMSLLMRKIMKIWMELMFLNLRARRYSISKRLLEIKMVLIHILMIPAATKKPVRDCKIENLQSEADKERRTIKKF
jgi:hypothetical protein